MKTLITVLCLFLATTAFAGTIGFRNISTANITTYSQFTFANISSNGQTKGTVTSTNVANVGNANATATCSVIKGKWYNGVMDVVSLTNVAIASKAGTGSITTEETYDYQIKCYQTAAPNTPKQVKFFINGSETNTYPMTELFVKHVR